MNDSQTAMVLIDVPCDYFFCGAILYTRIKQLGQQRLAVDLINSPTRQQQALSGKHLRPFFGQKIALSKRLAGS